VPVSAGIAQVGILSLLANISFPRFKKRTYLTLQLVIERFFSYVKIKPHVDFSENAPAFILELGVDAITDIECNLVCSDPSR
jgi:hypothetical protein